LLALSAKTEAALAALAKRYGDYLTTDAAPALADVCHTAATRRSHFDQRLSIVGASNAEVAQKLAAFHAGQTAEAHADKIATTSKIAFLFTGQGSQYVGMGRELYETEPAFRKTIDRCNEILRPWISASLLSVLYPDDETNENNKKIHETAYTQPAIFALEYALAQLWQSWGIQPDVLIGHSVGEYVAACFAGVFTLEEGLELIAARGRLMQALPTDGVMVAVQANETTVADAFAAYARAHDVPCPVEIATINAPGSVVIAGFREPVHVVVTILKARGIKTRPLEVSHAFHSALMEPMLVAFEQAANKITYTHPKIKLISNLTGKLMDAKVTTARYWRDHIRQAVRFADGLATLDQLGVDTFIEVGPKPTLIGFGQLCLPGKTNLAWLPSLRSGQSDWKQLLESLGALYVRGVAIDWLGLEKNFRAARQTVTLPNYPFQRKRHWIEVPDGRLAHRSGAYDHDAFQSLHPFFKRQIHSPALNSDEKVFENEISLARVPYIAEHEFFDSIILPGVTYLEMVFTAAKGFLPGKHLAIKNFIIPQALLLPNDTAVVTTLQLVCKPQSDASHTWHMYSANAHEPTVWTLHAAGEIVTAQLPPVQSIDFSAVRARCQERDVCSIYQALATTGMNVGPTFENIVQLFVGEGEALGQVRLPDHLHVESKAYTFVHFMLLDACLQVVQTLVPREYAHLPLGIDELSVYQPGQSFTTLWSHVQYRSGLRETGSHRLDIQLFDDAGRIVAVLLGVRFQRATKRSVRGANRMQDSLYQLAWQESPRAEVGPYGDASGHWLILVDQQGTGAALVAQLEQRGETCEFLTRPAGGADWSIDPKRVYRGIVYLWALDTHENSTIDQNVYIPSIVEQLCADVLQLAQSCAKCSNPPRLWLITRGAVADIDARPVQVQQAPLWGAGTHHCLGTPGIVMYIRRFVLRHNRRIAFCNALVCRPRKPNGFTR
jgi:acyl transferase domain-containing protein